MTTSCFVLWSGQGAVMIAAPAATGASSNVSVGFPCPRRAGWCATAWGLAVRSGRGVGGAQGTELGAAAVLGSGGLPGWLCACFRWPRVRLHSRLQPRSPDTQSCTSLHLHLYLHLLGRRPAAHGLQGCGATPRLRTPPWLRWWWWGMRCGHMTSRDIRWPSLAQHCGAQQQRQCQAH